MGNNKSQEKTILRYLFFMLIFSKLLMAESFTITDDGWLDQIVGFVKVNLNGNFAYLVIIVGVTIGTIGIMSGKWGLALTSFIGAIFVGSITFWAETAQTMGSSFE